MLLQATEDNEVGNAVKWALGCGYRHIDAAACYGNEHEVGAAMKVRLASRPITRGPQFPTVHRPPAAWCMP